jgi:hypothetical protein
MAASIIEKVAIASLKGQRPPDFIEGLLVEYLGKGFCMAYFPLEFTVFLARTDL